MVKNGAMGAGGTVPRRTGPKGTSKIVALEPRQLGLGELFFRTHDAILVAEATAGRIVVWNDAAVRVFGYTAEEAIGMLVEELVPETERARHRAGLSRYGKSGGGTIIDSQSPIEWVAVHKDGRSVWIEMTLSSLPVSGQPGRYAMAVVRDCTERKTLEDELRRSHQQLEETQALARLGSWEWDSSEGPARRARWSREMYRIHGVDPDSFTITKDTVDALIHPGDREMWVSRLSRAAELAEDLDGFAYRTANPAGAPRWVWTQGRFDPARPGVMAGYVQDITDQKAATDELARLALVDELTGLRNRRGFMSGAEPLLQLAHRDRRDVVLVYLDLDNLKTINDTQGHAAGDQALSQAADLLTRTFRESDLLARLGGDEFCALLHGDDPAAALRRLDAALRDQRTEPRISMSAGSATYSWREPCPVEELVARADADMYRSKAAKRP